ncbi:MAG: hypothetical protein OEZ45_15030 [Candidatus Aminicenantes bacterium]|nr:hypothetical protein [Candidatus Aminicenantes bacterium]
MGKILFRALVLLLVSALTLSSYSYGQRRSPLQWDGTDWLGESSQVCAKWLNLGIIVGAMLGTAAVDTASRELIDRITNELYDQRTTSVIELKGKMADLSLKHITSSQFIAGIDAQIRCLRMQPVNYKMLADALNKYAQISNENENKKIGRKVTNEDIKSGKISRKLLKYTLRKVLSPAVFFSRTRAERNAARPFIARHGVPFDSRLGIAGRNKGQDRKQ